MIELDTSGMQEEIAALMERYNALPNHIAKKHLRASMRRVMKYAVPALKKNTPRRRSYVRFGGGRNGREYTATRIRGGSLRSAVTTKAGYSRAKGGPMAVYGVVGYANRLTPAEAGPQVSQSRKAIWLEYGTRYAFARGMVKMTLSQIGGPSAALLAREMSAALEKAAAELAAGKNPARKYAPGGSWTPK